MTDIIELKKFYTENFSDCVDILKKCSYDSANKKYLCHLNYECFNFDKIKNSVCFNRNKLCSVDSLLITETKNTIYFIEFKNENYNSHKKNPLYSFQESFLMFTYLKSFCEQNSNTKPMLKSVLVLSEEKNAVLMTTLRKAKESNNIDDVEAYKTLKDQLVSNTIYNCKMFDEVIICSENDLEKIII